MLLPTRLSLILYLCIGVLPFTGMSFNWVYRISSFQFRIILPAGSGARSLPAPEAEGPAQGKPAGSGSGEAGGRCLGPVPGPVPVPAASRSRAAAVGPGGGGLGAAARRLVSGLSVLQVRGAFLNCLLTFVRLLLLLRHPQRPAGAVPGGRSVPAPGSFVQCCPRCCLKEGRVRKVKPGHQRLWSQVVLQKLLKWCKCGSRAPRSYAPGAQSDGRNHMDLLVAVKKDGQSQDRP